MLEGMGVGGGESILYLVDDDSRVRGGSTSGLLTDLTDFICLGNRLREESNLNV